MSTTVDYYFTPQSPWAYLDHERFARIACATGATVRVLPIDLGGRIFPLPGCPPRRQALRLLELQRHSEQLRLPLHLKPRYFPVSADDACRLIIAVALRDGADAAMRISGAIFAAVWARQRHIADEKVLAELLAECGLDAGRLEQSHCQAAHERYEENTAQAIVAGVFGAPSYVIDGERFQGQDRLDSVERKIRAASGQHSHAGV